jgi:hypothetical protein
VGEQPYSMTCVLLAVRVQQACDILVLTPHRVASDPRNGLALSFS